MEKYHFSKQWILDHVHLFYHKFCNFFPHMYFSSYYHSTAIIYIWLWLMKICSFILVLKIVKQEVITSKMLKWKSGKYKNSIYRSVLFVVCLAFPSVMEMLIWCSQIVSSVLVLSSIHVPYHITGLLYFWSYLQVICLALQNFNPPFSLCRPQRGRDGLIMV